jgi:hypothetical protein
MSMSGEPVPQRIGDAERDEAVGCLREHLAQGRLTAEEFDDRMTTALSAKVAADFQPLFTDLPSPRPTSQHPLNVESQLPWRPRRHVEPAPKSPVNRPAHVGRVAVTGLAVAASVAWPLAIVAMMMTQMQFWWLIIIPVLLSGACGGRRWR